MGVDINRRFKPKRVEPDWKVIFKECVVSFLLITFIIASVLGLPLGVVKGMRSHTEIGQNYKSLCLRHKASFSHVKNQTVHCVDKEGYIIPLIKEPTYVK